MLILRHRGHSINLGLCVAEQAWKRAAKAHLGFVTAQHTQRKHLPTQSTSAQIGKLELYQGTGL